MTLRPTMRYGPDPDALYAEFLRDAEQGLLDSTLANLQQLTTEQFVRLLEIAEKSLGTSLAGALRHEQ